MSEKSIHESEKESQPEGTESPDLVRAKGVLLDGISMERKWWGYHLHFTHQAIQTLVQNEGDQLVSLIVDVVKEILGSFPLAAEIVGASIYLRWEAMKSIDRDTGNGVKLTSPWIGLLMLIPSRRSGPDEDLNLWWMVYGDPQETSVYDHSDTTWVSDDAGGVWGEGQKFPGHQSASGASLATSNNVLYCVHRGGGSNTELWYSVFDGEKSWKEDVRVPEHLSEGNPAVAFFENRLYCVHRGRGSDDQLWYTVFDGTSWSRDTRISYAFSKYGPALTVYENKLYCVHRGAGSDEYLYSLTFQNGAWSADHKITGAMSASEPALAVYNDKLYCVHRGSGSNQQLWYLTFQNGTWSADQSIEGAYSSVGPALAVYKNRLYCVHRGVGPTQQLWYLTFQNGTWSADQSINASTGGQPGLVVYHDQHTGEPQLFCVHRGYS